MQLFFIPLISDKKFILPEQEAKHCINVVRLKTKDTIWLTSGDGTLYQAEICKISGKEVEVEIIHAKHDFEKRNYYLHIAIAPTKSIDRFEWFIEKATEIGIDEITPLLTEHSERKNLRIDRLERIIIAAIKQSAKAYKPKLNQMTKFAQFLENFNFTGERYIATCLEEPKDNIGNLYKAGSNAMILIGPEGDFSTNEIHDAQQENFQTISLGKSRLRTETAGVVSCYAISLKNNEN